MTERRIAHIVGKTGCRNNVAYLGHVGLCQLRMFKQQTSRHVIAERAAYARYFQAVCKAIMDEYASRQREHLRLVLQPTERS